MPSTRPSISLCVVARDEEGFIAGCLASARAVADELLVLDTGSTDMTPRLAAAGGARVVRWRWRDHYGQAFAAVRRAASGDWILNLDADEVLDTASHDAVRRLVERPVADAYLPLIRTYHYAPKPRWRPADPASPASLGAYGWSPSRTVRLFRNDPRFHYTGIVHHGVAPSVVAAGGALAATDDVILHHYGDLRLDKTPLKADHYRRLAERKVRDEPGNARAWIELGVVLDHLGPLSEALACFTRAAERGGGAGAWYLSGLTRLHAGDLTGAARDLETALREDPDDDAPDFDRADAYEALALAHRDRGDVAGAERAFRQALEARPASPAAANNLADLLARTGRADAARPLVTALLRDYPGLDAVRCTLGNVLAAEGDDAAAERAYRDALAIQPENLPARVNLARVLARTGRPAAAGRAYRLAAERVPRAGPQAGLAPYIPASGRPRRVAAPPGSAPLLVSLVPYIGSGAGRVMLEVIRALDGYRHLVLCADPGSYDGFGYRDALRRLGAPSCVVRDTDAVLKVLERTAASGLIFHWWSTTRFAGLAERCPVPRILVGHAVTQMPEGPDAYVVLSAYHRRTQGHLPADRVHLIPNGAALDAPLSLARGRRSRARAVMLARLDPGKFPRRLPAFLPDLTACRGEVIVGGRGARSFEIAPDLQRVAWGDRVRFRGVVPWTRVPAFLAGADVGLHLTETSLEVCSLSVIQMLAAGLPVVSQPRGCLPEMVRHGESGFLSESEEEIAAALRELLLDPALRRSMGEAARERARHYDLRSFAAAYRELVGAVVT